MQENQEPSLEAQEEILLQEAAQADAEGRIIDEQTSIDENQETTVDPAEDKDEANNETTKPSNEDEPQNGEDKPDADNSQSDDGTQSAESSDKSKEEHPKSKQEKEDERRERSWKKLEEAKAEFLREKAEWQAEQASFNSQPNQNAENPQSLAKAFEDIAKKFEDEGDFDKADEARKKAEELRKMPAPAANNPQPQNNQHFQAAWNTNIERAINDFPEMKDPESDFGKTVKALINAPDSAAYFKGRPDGIYVAAQLANMKMTALRVPELEKENASLKEEIKKLRQGVSLPDTGSRTRAGETLSLENMPLAQQEAYWKHQAELADAGFPTI